MSMTFQVVSKSDVRVFSDDEITRDDTLEISISAGNDAYVLNELGFTIINGMWEERLDKFIEHCAGWYDHATRTKRLTDTYLSYQITRLWTYALRAKARDGYVIMGA